MFTVWERTYEGIYAYSYPVSVNFGKAFLFSFILSAGFAVGQYVVKRIAKKFDG